jgi:hypothetical protein
VIQFRQKGLLITSVADAIDLSRAAFDPTMSSIGFSEEESVFWATPDHLTFQSLPAAVFKVLESHGYVSNIENLLACFDHYAYGVVALTRGDDSNVAKKYNVAVMHSMPKKNRVGPILQAFYSEVQRLDAEIQRLGRVKGDGDGEDQQASIDRLSTANRKLKAQLDEVAQELAKWKRTYAAQARSIASAQLLPPNVRHASCREIDLNNNLLHLRIGRSQASVPLADVWHIPIVNSACLVTTDEPRLVIPLAETEPASDVLAAKVLSASDDKVRIKDCLGRKWTLPYNKPTRRGDDIVVRVFRDHAIAVFSPREAAKQIHWLDVQAAIAKRQLQDVQIEKSVVTPSMAEEEAA